MSVPPVTWNEPEERVLDILTAHGANAAALPVLDAASATGAERTRVAVRAALRMLLANGLIAAVPPEDWPAYLAIDPPRREEP